MKITAFEKQILLEAKAERKRLRHMLLDLSDYALSKTLGITIKQVAAEMTIRQRPMTTHEAIDLANTIRRKNCVMALFKTKGGWSLTETSKLGNDYSSLDGYVATYNNQINAQQILNDAR